MIPLLIFKQAGIGVYSYLQSIVDQEQNPVQQYAFCLASSPAPPSFSMFHATGDEVTFCLHVTPFTF